MATWGDCVNLTCLSLFRPPSARHHCRQQGFQVPPAELEASLLECPFVADAAVIGVWDDNQASEFPRAYVVVSDEGQRQTDPANAVRDWLDSRVSNHKKLRG